MDTLPEDVEDYNSKIYWESRFKDEDEYDWLCSYEKYGKQLESFLRPEDSILILGCGNSTLSARLYQSGFKHISNIDYSENVIAHMKKKHAAFTEMNWLTMDILEMNFDHCSFDIVIDKATLDSFMVGEKDPWHISDNIQSVMDKILQKVSDLLKDGGKFISITWAQPHFRKRLLAKPKYHWSIQTLTFGTGLEFFIYSMAKGDSLSQADMDLGEIKLERSTETPVYLPLETYNEEEFLNNFQI